MLTTAIQRITVRKAAFSHDGMNCKPQASDPVCTATNKQHYVPLYHANQYVLMMLMHQRHKPRSINDTNLSIITNTSEILTDTLAVKIKKVPQ